MALARHLPMRDNLDDFAVYENQRFFNLLAQKAEDSFPYFDAREDKGLQWASPIQCYLELSGLGKREKEIAATVRESILDKLK